MNEKPSGRQMDEAASTVKKTVLDGAAAVTDAAGKAAGNLRDAASSVRDSAVESSAWQAGASLAEDASERITEAADYVRETSTDDMWSDVVNFVKARPAESLAAAVIAGFLLGRMARRS